MISSIVILGAMLSVQSAASTTMTAPAATPSPAAASPVAPATDDPGNKMRCKRYTETGSLAHIVKECHTVKEWHDLAENARRNATRYQDDGAITTWHTGQ
jgi:hypothetical protein